MKIRRLPDIDLARIAPLPPEQQRRQLEQMRNGRPPFSYDPLRGCFHDIFNVQPEMFGPVVATDWSVIAGLLQRKCRSEDELRSNLAVAKGLHQFTTEVGMLGRAQEFFPLAMGTGQKVSYWLSLILLMNGRAIVPFIDPRRSKGLTREARRFVFSMMHERIRAVDPDYAAVGFGIFQFGDLTEGQRKPVVHSDEGVELFSLDQMEAMVEATYALWREILAERDEDARRRGTGTTGPLL